METRTTQNTTTTNMKETGMKVTDIVKWNLESGKEIEARIEITREVQLEKTVWVDQEITLPCYEMYENNEITCWVDDKCVARGNSLIVVRPQNSKYYAPRTIGAIGKVCLRQPAYDAVKTAYDSAIAEVEANADVIAY